MDRIGAFRRAQAILNKFRRTGVTVDLMVRFLRHLLDIGAWRQLEQVLIPDVFGEVSDPWTTEYVYNPDLKMDSPESHCWQKFRYRLFSLLDQQFHL